MRCLSRRWRTRSIVPNSPPSTAKTTATAIAATTPRRLTSEDPLDAIQRAARELARVAELFLDAQELIVLRDAIRSARRAGLDLSGAGCNGEVRDERVLGLTRTMRDH